MLKYIEDQFTVHKALIDTVAKNHSSMIAAIANEITSALFHKKKIMVMGNGGSAADAQHFVAELVGRFQSERYALPALCLAANMASVTAIGNDYGFEEIFARQIEGLASDGDVVIAISTSGNSQNIISALKKARKQGCVTIGLLGKSGGIAASLADHPLVVPSDSPPAIQEVHITIIHILSGLIEKKIASENPAEQQP